MASKKKSLAQELADLFNPAPTKEYDPDALDLGEGAKLASDDEYAEARQAPSKRAPEKAMLLRGDITLEDAAYRGRKTSRSAMFGDDDGAADSDDDEDVDLDLGGEDDDDDDDEEHDGSSEGEEDDGGEERRAAVGRAGPSGRAGAAAAAGGPAAGRGTRGKSGSAALANGGAPASSEGEEDEGEDEDAQEGQDGELPSGSGSDVDLGEDGPGGSGTEEEDGGLEGEEEEDEEEDEERGRRGRADGPSKRPAGRAGGGSSAGGAGGGELEALEAEYEALQEDDERQLAALRRKGERDREKGVAVRNQQVLYERALEQRILLQKCLQASNGLPRPDTHAALVAAQPDIREGYAQLAAAARDTLGQLLELQHVLMGRNSAVSLPPAAAVAAAAGDGAPAASGRAAAGGKRRRPNDDDDDEGPDGGGAAADSGLDALWARISSHHEALAPFRDVSLDSWHRRTVLSSGSGALRNSGLRALNQSISSQVQALMRDPGKFIKRTRLVLSACPRVLCEPPREGAGAGAAALDPLGGDAEPAAAAAAAAAAAVATSSVAADVTEEERDPETYDDSEFYQQLLKEFLDKGLMDGAAAAPKSAKKRKLVDRRASKGRKLRYHVQEKLVAFMAPVDFTPPPFAANLFSNLFGHAGK